MSFKLRTVLTVIFAVLSLFVILTIGYVFSQNHLMRWRPKLVTRWKVRLYRPRISWIGSCTLVLVK